MKILRRYYSACVKRYRGKSDNENEVTKLEILMYKAKFTTDIFSAVSASLLKAETTGSPAGAIVLPDGQVVTEKPLIRSVRHQHCCSTH